MAMRLFRRLYPIIGLFLVFQLSAFGQYEIIKQSDAKIFPVSIESSNDKVKGLAQMAFNSHGAFQLTSTTKASRVIILTPAGNNSCRVKVVAGQPAQVLYESTVSGSDENNAVLRACDAAVKAITGQPGYFGGTIAYVSNRSGNPQVWMGDLFFRSARPITNSKFIAQRPYLSPDANTLFYRSYERRFPDIFKYDVSTGRAKVFAGYKGTNAGGAVSPNGQSVALTLSSPGNMELFIADIDQQSKPRRLTTNRYVETDPAWSGDGRRLVITSDQLGYPQLFEIAVNGGVMSRLPTNISRYCAEPSWNPRDESKIVFTAAINRGYELALYEFGKGDAKALTNAPGDAKEPTWLADGRHILFTEKNAGKERLVIIDSETGKRTPVSPDNFGNASQASYAY